MLSSSTASFHETRNQIFIESINAAASFEISVQLKPLTPSEDLRPIGFALDDVDKVAAEVVSVVRCGMAVVEDVIVAMSRKILVMFDELVVSLRIGFIS